MHALTTICSSDVEIFERVVKHLNYSAVIFRTRDNIYHTNVMMSICDRFAVVCAEAITEEDR